MQVLKERCRQAILKSARKEFLKKGFDKASMRLIAEGAGMTVGNLYRYAKDKADLFAQVVGTNTLSMELWERDTKAFYMLVEKKLTKIQAVDLILENLGVMNLIEIIEKK